MLREAISAGHDASARMLWGARASLADGSGVVGAARTADVAGRAGLALAVGARVGRRIAKRLGIDRSEVARAVTSVGTRPDDGRAERTGCDLGDLATDTHHGHVVGSS